jgi:hypothetical protein
MGLTPGWHQARIAIEAYRKALRSGTTTESALQIAGATASFEGMRTRLCGWLDKLGIADRLGIGSTTQLFEDSHSHLLHSTSLVRFPVFVGAGRSNYSGHNPRPSASPLLSYVARNILAREIQELPQALIVPLGRAVGDGLAHLSTPLHSLEGFPHPSGANGHGPAQFERNVGEMTDVVANFPWAG